MIVEALVGAVVSVAATFGARRLAHALGFVSRPNPIVPQHTRTVAYLGGLGVAAGIAAALAWTAKAGEAATGVAVAGGGAAFLALGILDDLRAFGPALKFLLQGVIAAGAVAAGVRAELLGVPALDAALSWLWICTLVNAFNFVDVSDGLLASLSACVFAGIAAAFPSQAAAAACVGGACAGFLVLNHPPASIFLGDAGSHLLGFLAAALTLGGIGHDRPGVPGMFVATMLLAVPLFELVFITVVRIRKGLPWWKGSPDHFALRLQAAGVARPRLNALTCALSLAVTGAALAGARGSWAGMAVVAAGVGLVAAACWRRLLDMPGGGR